MALPGKLVLGFLQEDNPLKFYFRVRPLITRDDGGYARVENAKEQFEDDGFIRIVPDKNELSHFKSRMRALGRYCLLDLRKHPNENDKIRPNKNHSGENGDRNAYIIYSDVVARAPALSACEVYAPPENGAFAEAPGTSIFALAEGGVISGPYRLGEGGASELCGARFEVAESEAATFTVELEDGLSRTLLLDLQALGVQESEAAAQPEAGKAAEAARPIEPAKIEEPARPVEAARPVEPAKPAEIAKLPESAPKQPEAADKPAEQPAEMEDKPGEAVKPAAREAQARIEPEAVREAAAKAEPAPAKAEMRDVKPWLAHTTFVFPRVVAEKVKGEQRTGFNPRKSMSLKEIVDDQWRQSRYDQLGHPVPGAAKGSPVVSPVEQAISALKEAWAIEEARDKLLMELQKLDDMRGVMNEANAPHAAEERAVSARLDQLEAERLKLAGEIDDLRKEKQEKRDELLAAVRQSHRTELAASEENLCKLAASREKCARELDEARKARSAAEDALGRLIDGNLDETLSLELLESRAGGLLRALTFGESGCVAPTETSEPSAGELISDLRARFEGAGMPLTNDEAVSLLAALTLGGTLLIYGDGGAEFARVLAAALGLFDNGRFVELRAREDTRALGDLIETRGDNGAPIVKNGAARALLTCDDELTPLILMINDANRAPIERYAPELIARRELGARQALETPGETLPQPGALRVLMVIADDNAAKPLTGETLSEAWMLRVPARPEPEEWPAPRARMPKPESTVSLAHLKRVFEREAELPTEVTSRVKLLRERLAALGVRVGGRALDDVYRFCAAVLPLMQCEPLDALDWALAQRALPAILATASLDALHELNKAFFDMPRCLELFTLTLPLPPL